jgi:hypothetical protein
MTKVEDGNIKLDLDGNVFLDTVGIIAHFVSLA